MTNGIVLLRPALSAQADLAVCASLNWSPLVIEYQKIKPIVTALSALADLSLTATVVFWVSPATVHVAAPYLPNRPGLLHVAVGRATAKTLRSYGFEQVFCPTDGQDSETVWQLPLWHQSPIGKVLWLGGEGGRTWLLEKLRKIGWPVQLNPVYQRLPQVIDWTQVTQLDQQIRLRAVYITTRVGVTAWFEQLPLHLHAQLKSLIYLTHHPRVHQALIQYDVHSILMSDLHQGLTLLHTDSK